MLPVIDVGTLARTNMMVKQMIRPGAQEVREVITHTLRGNARIGEVVARGDLAVAKVEHSSTNPRSIQTPSLTMSGSRKGWPKMEPFAKTP